MKPLKTEHYNRLPHFRPIGSFFFITFRLKNSLPTKVIEGLKAQRDKTIQNYKNSPLPNKAILIYEERKRYFGKFDKLLDNSNKGSTWLVRPSIAQIVADKIHGLASEGFYNLIAYCIMSNHVHLIIDMGKQLNKIPPLAPINGDNYTQIDHILKRLKGSTARFANLKLQRTGQSF